MKGLQDKRCLYFLFQKLSQKSLRSWEAAERQAGDIQSLNPVIMSMTYLSQTTLKLESR